MCYLFTNQFVAIVLLLKNFGASGGRDRMVVGFTTTCAISTYCH